MAPPALGGLGLIFEIFYKLRVACKHKNLVSFRHFGNQPGSRPAMIGIEIYNRCKSKFCYRRSSAENKTHTGGAQFAGNCGKLVQ